MYDIKLNKIRTISRYSAPKESWTRNSQTNGHIIAYQISGRFLHFYEGREIMIVPDTVIFINDNDTYRVERKEIGMGISCHFNTVEPIDLHFCTFEAEKMPQIKTDFTNMLNAWNRRDEFSWCDALSCFYTIMSKLLHCVEDEKAGNDQASDYIQRKRYQYMKKAYDYIALNYHDPRLSIGDLAEIAGVSQRRFGELFNMLYGTTPGHYITNLRMMTAKEMLLAGGYTIAEIAASVGYISSSYFCRVFLREVGTTPSLWVDNARGLKAPPNGIVDFKYKKLKGGKV